MNDLREQIKPEGVDLSNVRDQSAVDLSPEAVDARDVKRRVARAASWARRMNRTFKGISKRPRPEQGRRALEREGVDNAMLDRAADYFRGLREAEGQKEGDDGH